jgi:hypothetical protein
MKHLITLKDTNIHVEPEQKPAWWHGDTSLAALPQAGQDFFEHGEYLTLEFDDVTGQMRVWHPEESKTAAIQVALPFSVYRKYMAGSNWRDEKTYQVSIYSDGLHTCECPADFFHPGNCKHITSILENAPYMGELWEILENDDRPSFREKQSGLYDTRPKDSDGEAAKDA